MRFFRILLGRIQSIENLRDFDKIRQNITKTLQIHQESQNLLKTYIQTRFELFKYSKIRHGHVQFANLLIQCSDELDQS